jgi:hypothetical protein
MRTLSAHFNVRTSCSTFLLHRRAPGMVKAATPANCDTSIDLEVGVKRAGSASELLGSMSC